VPSSGCGKATSLKGESQTTINVTEAGAGNRQYYIRLPDNYDQNHPYALWFAIHCLNGSAENVAHSEPDNRANYEYFGMWKLANPAGGKATTIFVAPQGINAGWGEGAKDLAFFRAMITKFESELCIDTSRIFASGFSMGGSMSYALACAMPDKMRAIGMYSGGSMSGCDQSKRGPVSIFISHGTEDGTCTWPGSGEPQINDLAKRCGCQTEDLASECHPTSRMDPVCITYKGCNPGYAAEACIFKGEHIGSPGTQGTYGKNDTWVPQKHWDFVKQFY
jgi:poly(3-hydroxybutyrate) depolymerase